MSLKHLLLTSLTACVCTSALCADLAIKGISLGSPTSAACGQSEVFDVSGRGIKDDVPEFVVYNLKSCTDSIKSYASVGLQNPSDMLFMNDRLIAVRLELESIDMDKLASVITATQDLFGKAKLSHNKDGATYVWSRAGNELIIERNSPSWDDNRLVIYLRNKNDFARYLKLQDQNMKAIKDAEKERAKKDIRG